MSKVFAGLIGIEAVLVVAGIAVASAAPMGAKMGAQKTASDGTPINACALLSHKEVEDVVGKKVTEGTRQDEGVIADNPFVTTGTYSSTCFWQVVNPDLAPDPDLPMHGASFIILNAMQWPDGPDGAHRFLQGFHDAAKNGDIPHEPIAVQVKEEALWWGDGVAGRVRDRSYGISVHIVGNSKPQEQQHEEALARKIAPRL